MADGRGAARRQRISPVVRAVRRLGGAVLGVLYMATVSLGALSTPLAVLLLFSPGLALSATALYLWAYGARLHTRPPRHQVLTAAFAGAGLLPFVSGAEMLGELGAVVVVVVLALAALVLAAHLLAADPFTALRRLPGSTVVPDMRDGATGTDEVALRALLRRAPLPSLFRRWHATGRTIAAASNGQGYEAAVYLRGLLLDELHTRDPTGTQRWIEHGAGPPEPHIRRDQPLTD